jgi:hypothetical protein
MPRRLPALVLAVTLAGTGAAGDTPVVVELFTSQGCSACPPADAFHATLAERPGIVALAFHVDYWDYLGWRDSFASPAFSKRQRAYAKAFGERMVYTPQMVINGRVGLVGSHVDEIDAAIAEAAARPVSAAVRIETEADGLRVVVEPGEGAVSDASVSYVLLAHPQTIAISRGENRGQEITYHNVVRAWMMLGSWHGEPLSWAIAAPQDARSIVVLVQEKESRAILGAARRDLAQSAD